MADEPDGEVAYDLDDFRRHHGDPTGQSFTLEVTTNLVTYVYANVTGTIRADQVVFDLYGEDLVDTQRAH